MIIYSIYKVVNQINGKVYIGFDSKWPNRVKKHKWNYLKSKQKKNFRFYCALRKYGWDNFKWEIIYQSKDGQHCLKVMESHFIQEYDSYLNGYNMTLGGDGTLGKEPWNKGKKMQAMDSEIKKRISQTMTGKLRTKEHCDNLSESMKGKKNNNKKLKTPDGIFKSAKDAAQFYGLNKNTMYYRIYHNPEIYQYIK
jgi:group I intron endonuclease